MKIAHFSDPHLGAPTDDWTALFDKRWVGLFNYKFRRSYQHDPVYLEKAVQYINEWKDKNNVVYVVKAYYLAKNTKEILSYLKTWYCPRWSKSVNDKYYLESLIHAA